jgi:hypothetical protein
MKKIITAILLITNSIGYSQIKVKTEKSADGRGKKNSY